MLAHAPYLRLRAAIVPADLTIILGVGLIGWQQAAGSLPDVVEWIVFLGLLAGVGIPHGALDHLIDRETAIRQGKPFSLASFLTRYLLTIAVYGAAWFWMPALCLVLFLISSAWHFGETDLERVPPGLIWTSTRLIAGGFVLAFILLTHPLEVSPILERIASGNFLVVTGWHVALAYTTPILWSWGFLLALTFAGAVSLDPPAFVDWFRLVRWAIVLTIGYNLPLLPAFALYFGGWHALSSFQTIDNYLGQTNMHRQTAWQIWRKSLPMTGVALTSLFLFGWIARQYAPEWDLLPLLFVLLSLITLPHLTVMHGMNSRIR